MLVDGLDKDSKGETALEHAQGGDHSSNYGNGLFEEPNQVTCRTFTP